MHSNCLHIRITEKISKILSQAASQTDYIRISEEDTQALVFFLNYLGDSNTQTSLRTTTLGKRIGQTMLCSFLLEIMITEGIIFLLALYYYNSK